MTVLTVCALLFLAYLAVVAATVVYLGRKDRARQANLDYIDHVRRDQERRLAARDEARRLERDAGEVSAWTLAGVALIVVLAVIVAGLTVLVVKAPTLAASLVFVAGLAVLGYAVGGWLEDTVMPEVKRRALHRRAVKAGIGTDLVTRTGDRTVIGPDPGGLSMDDADLWPSAVCTWPQGLAYAPATTCGAPATTWRPRPLLQDDRLWTASPVCDTHALP